MTIGCVLHYQLHCSFFILFPSVSISLFMFHLSSISPHFIVHVSPYFLQSTLHCSCFISVLLVHTSLIMFNFYFLQSTVHLFHFTYYSPSHSYLPYLFVFIYYMVIQPYCQFHFSTKSVSAN